MPDPHRDLAREALDHILRRLTNELVYIDPADRDRSTGFNPPSRAPLQIERHSTLLEYTVFNVTQIEG